MHIILYPVGIIYLLLWLLTYPIIRALSLIVDPMKFRSLTKEYDFTYIGKWSTADGIGIFGVIGVIVDDEECSAKVYIYYSSLQSYRRKELEILNFKRVDLDDEIPNALMIDAAWLFPYLSNSWISYENEKQPIRACWNGKDQIMKSGRFYSKKPRSIGNFTLKLQKIVEPLD